MHIVHIIESLRSGGKERQLVELLRGLNDRENIKCSVILMSDEIHYDLPKLNISFYVVERKYKKDFLVFFRFFQLLKKVNPDLVHSWGSMCSVYALPFVCLMRTKFVNGYLRDVPPYMGLKSRLWLRSKLTFPFSDAIVANSYAGLKAYNSTPNKSCCIYNGFDFSRIASLRSESDIRLEFNIETKFIIGMVASFTKNKDFNSFIEIAHKILAQRDDVTFLAIGDGVLLSEVQSRVLLEHRNRIKFLGKRKDVESLINVFTVGVLLTNKKNHGEGISNSIMEYMALGKPVIATDCGGNSEILKDGEYGFISRGNNVDEIKNWIHQFLDDPELCEKYGRAGYTNLVNNFSISKATNNFMELYSECLESK